MCYSWKESTTQFFTKTSDLDGNLTYGRAIPREVLWVVFVLPTALGVVVISQTGNDSIAIDAFYKTTVS